MYAHLSKVNAKKGDWLNQGDVTAYSGNTGLTTGAHLHYGVWEGETLINPMKFLKLEYTNDVLAEYLARGEEIH